MVIFSEAYIVEKSNVSV